MVCNSCGEKPENTAKDFTKAVVEINNPEKLVLFRKVVVPASMGTEEDFPASVGKYYNVLLQYEANGDMYLYSSDGIPTKLSSDVSELQHELEQLGIKVDGEILARIAGDDALSGAIADEKTAREDADIALSNSITALDDSLATVAKTGNYNDLTNKPTIGNATLTIKRNNANVGTFTANATTDKSVDISVPTKTSDITNDGSDGSSTYVENDELSAVATSGSYNDLLNKPTIGNATLTIKKNNTNVGTFTANATSNKSIDITVPTKTSELTNNGSDNTSTYVESDDLATVATSGSYNDLTNKPTIGNATLTIKRNNTNAGTFTANATTNKSINIAVPTKTSDLTNDGADGTSTFVEADDLPVVDTTYSASSNNAIANSTVTNSLNRDVMTNLTLDTNPSTTTVNLNNTKTNLASPSSTTTTAIALPVASSTQAGVMNSSTFDAVTNNTNNINALLSGAVAVTGLPASPSQSDITTAWQTETGLSTLINRASVYDVTNNKVWTYYTNDTTWHAASNTSQVTVNTFTNSSEGVIKGSTNTGQVFAENDGTGSVNGWDTLTGTVANHTSKLATIEQGAEVNVQSNWTQTNTTADDYIKNKPANLVQDANYVHTDNNFTTTLKNKLDGIESGAEVNQNAFSNVSVNGVTVAADAKTDTLTLTAGNNVTLTGDASSDTVTISSTDTNTTYSFANGTNGFTVTPSGGSAQTITVTPSIDDVTTSTSGLMSAADKTEFDLSNRVQRRLIGDGTTIPDNSDLNTIPFLSVGRYVIQGSVHASTLINSPTTKSFTMEVFNSADSVLDNEATGRYIYRVRRITTYDGNEYKQYVHSSSTAGVFIYGNWLKIATTSDIPTVNNATLTIQKNGTNVQTFTANSSENKTANITVPTAVSELTNDANYATTTQLSDGLATKQNTLTAGNAITITGDTISADVYPADFFTSTTETTTGTGTDITLTNTALAPFASVTPKGDTSQQTYTGKNLFNTKTKTSQVEGLNLTVEDNNNITLADDGTHGGWRSVGFQVDGLTVNTQYAFRFYQSNSNTSMANWLNVKDGNNQDLINNYYTSGSTVTFTVTKTSAKFYFYAQTSNGTVANNTATITNIQLEAGSTLGNYEPYVGGVPAPNPDYPQDVKVVTGEQTVTVTGKNMFDKENRSPLKGYFDGNQPTSTIVIDNSNRNRFIYVPCEPSTAYSVSFASISGLNPVQVGVTTELPVSGVAVTSLGIISSQPFKLENVTTIPNAKYIVMRFQTQNSGDNIETILPNCLAGLQIEKGPVATEYEVGQSQDYIIGLYGKNMFDGKLANGSYYTTIALPNRLFCTLPIRVKRGYTYTLSMTGDDGNLFRFALNASNIPLFIGSASTGILGYDSGWKTSSTTYTSDYDYVGIIVSRRDNGDLTPSDVIGCKFQLEAGDQATSFEAYTPIELCKIGDYQDYIYKSGGNWYKHEAIKKITLDGTENWSSRTNAAGTLQMDVVATTGTPVAPSVASQYCNYASYESSAFNYGLVGEFLTLYNTKHLVIGVPSTTTVESWKTMLGGYNLTAYFVLATATDTQITDSGLIAQLEALANANSYRGTTHIDTASDGYNLPMILTAEAFTNSLAGISKVIDGKQNKLTAGENITIDANNVISATATGNSTITMTDTDPGEGQPLADDNYIAVYGGSGQGGFSRYTASQSISAATTTTLLPDTTQTPDDGISYANGVAVIQKAGWWILTATVGGAQTAAGYLTVEIAVNNVAVSSASGATTANYTHCRNVIWAGKLSVGDTVKVQVTTQSAMSINKRERGVFCGVLVSED